MRWKRGQRSGDLVDRRGRTGLSPAGMGGAIGVPGIILLVVMMFLRGGSGGDTGAGGIDDILGDLQNPAGPASGAPPTAEDEKLVDFMSFVLDDVQNFWADTFKESGKTYPRAKLVIFTGSTNSGCGGATAAIGPHYCPPDQNVYLDLGFFQDLRKRFGAPGDFAQAYVLAHEIGHHVQNVLGVNDDVRKRQQADPGEANELSVRLELQADCFAGVWAFTAYEADLLESGDLEEGLGAAEAVGDDRIQEQSGGRVNPENWTHGSSEQRSRWFRAGYEDGDPNACDTFSAESL
ncbi:MAG: zinc metallopeptidase [Actinomycetota bacterium]|nr:zinc metallopeptidase [Actinomycetota bacterium]